METRQMTQFFHLLFPLILFLMLIFVSEKSKNSFSRGPPFDPFLSVNTSILDKSYKLEQPIYFSRK